MVEHILSMICYWAAIGVSLTAATVFSKRKTSNKYEHVLWTALICLPLAVIAGLRDGVGTDYYNYIRMFQRIEELSLLECFTHSYLDVLFAVIIRLLLYITSNTKVIFFVLSFAMLYIMIAVAAKQNKYVNVTLFVLFYYLIVFHPSLNIVRQCLSVSLFVWSVSLLLKKKYVPGTVISLANVLIHNTALIGFVCLAVLLYVQWSVSENESGQHHVNWRLCAYYAAILISPLLIPSLLNLLIKIPAFSGYAKYIITDAQVGIGQIVYSLALFLPFLAYRKTIVEDDKMFGLFHVALLYIPVSYMGYYFNYASRMNIYTLMIIALLVSMIVKKQNRETKMWVFVLWYILFFGYLYFTDIVINNYHETFPYIWSYV